MSTVNDRAAVVEAADRLAAAEAALADVGELLRELAGHECVSADPAGVEPPPELAEPRTTAGADALAQIEDRWGPAATVDRETTEHEEQE